MTADMITGAVIVAVCAGVLAFVFGYAAANPDASGASIIRWFTIGAYIGAAVGCMVAGWVLG